jgi:hypothetical protein
MKNKHDRKRQNYRIEQTEIRIEPSSNADNSKQNKYHNARIVSLGPNTRRQG